MLNNGLNAGQDDLLEYLALLKTDLFKNEADMLLGREVESDAQVAAKKKLREEHQQ